MAKFNATFSNSAHSGRLKLVRAGRRLNTLKVGQRFTARVAWVQKAGHFRHLKGRTREFMVLIAAGEHQGVGPYLQ